MTFQLGARTSGTHTLSVSPLSSPHAAAGAQREGDPIEEIRPGDVIWFSPNEKHRHGASPITAVTHIAMREKFNGKVVDSMEHVSDDQYRR